MRGVDKVVVLGLPVVALLAAFWFLILSPKREEASSLEADVSALEAEIAAQEAVADAAEAARDTFPVSYKRMVVLGKAVPKDADTSSMLVQLSRNAVRSGIGFDSLNLVPGASGMAAATTAPAPVTPAGAAEGSEQAVASAEAGTPPPPIGVTPTETAVAGLPIGATVGPAGLPVMPYELGFVGGYFGIAEFVGRLNSQVGLNRDGRPSVFGRLITIDGFSIAVPEDSQAQAGTPTSALEAGFSVTTFLAPSGEGLTAGATPAGPAPTAPQAVSTSTTQAAPPTASVGGVLPKGATP